MKTVFLRALEADVDEKAAVLKAAIHASEDAAGRTRFEVVPTDFGALPMSPFAYWVSDSILRVFNRPEWQGLPERSAKNGLGTLDDFRFVRLDCEVAPREVGPGRKFTPFSKGGKRSPYYQDVPTVVDWADDGATVKAYIVHVYKGGHWSRNARSADFYLQPGLTWPLRGIRFSSQAVPRGGIFSVGGKQLLAAQDHLLLLLAVFNSSPFDALVRLFAGKVGGVQYESGLIDRLPVPKPDLTTRAWLEDQAQRAWSLKRKIDTITENSHAFAVPALLQAHGDDLSARAKAWDAQVIDTLAELERIQTEIDDRCFTLYGISDQDRRSIEKGFGAEVVAAAEGEPEDLPLTDPGPLVENLLSWTVGVAFGRFDLRLATGERPAPAEPEPFDPLPPCSPGMLTGDDGLPLDASPESYPIAFPEDGILVDDPGHARDLGAAARAVFDVVFADGDARWHEAAELVGAGNLDLRRWFARDFFPLHIKAYSKSRRKAPIYWQLATPSASYSVWVYYHRFSRDTLFRVLHDFVAPKLRHEESKLNQLVTEAGPEPSRSQRAEVDAQETFVNELRAFRSEVDRVAALWNPDLNDGVIINFAPLWRLVPQNKTWQKEVRKVWDKLAAGDYDWAHLAMHLWPERVVPKCRDDRSLAIAHRLEDALWYEADEGKWQKRRDAGEKIEAMIAERASPAVKAARDDLLSASAPAAGRKTGKRRGTRTAGG